MELEKNKASPVQWIIYMGILVGVIAPLAPNSYGHSRRAGFSPTYFLPHGAQGHGNTSGIPTIRYLRRYSTALSLP